jgi:hypothetical protein
MFLGEFPPLPPELIQALHNRVRETDCRVINYVWGNMAEGASCLFDDW